MGKEKEGYRVPDEKKKPCPYCGLLISKQGLRMHHNFKHPGEEFVLFDEIKGKATPQKPKPKQKSEPKSFPGREGREESGSGSGESGEESEEDEWGTII